MKKILMVVALLAATAGMAFATSVTPLTGSLCVNKTDGVIRSISASKACATTELRKSLPVSVGPTGPTGQNGTNGADGAQGLSGVNGNTGPPGSVGPQGATGLTGMTGATGPIGQTGQTGPAGATGPQGPKGDPGVSGYVMGTICVDNSTSTVKFQGVGDYTCNIVSSKYHILVQP